MYVAQNSKIVFSLIKSCSVRVSILSPLLVSMYLHTEQSSSRVEDSDHTFKENTNFDIMKSIHISHEVFRNKCLYSQFWLYGPKAEGFEILDWTKMDQPTALIQLRTQPIHSANARKNNSSMKTALRCSACSAVYVLCIQYTTEIATLLIILGSYELLVQKRSKRFYTTT